MFKKCLGQEILKNDPKTLSRLSGSIKTEIAMSKYPRKKFLASGDPF